MDKWRIPFKTPLDYFQQALLGNPENINRFREIQEALPIWKQYDNDLHVYPYVHALPSMLSMGCPNQCPFCPSGQFYKGKVYRGIPEVIIPQYAGENVHWMDENFFDNDMKVVLPLLKKHNLRWLAMADVYSTKKVLDEFGEDYLHDCGCRCIEVGLENVVHMRKVKEPFFMGKIPIYYLNMTFFEGETKESIWENRMWMNAASLEHPIHFNNGLWYAPGQYYHPYVEGSGHDKLSGLFTNGSIARTKPSFVPHSFLNQKYKIVSMETVNHYSQLIYDFKMYPLKSEGSIYEFVGDPPDVKRTMWLVVGCRTGGIK